MRAYGHFSLPLQCVERIVVRGNGFLADRVQPVIHNRILFRPFNEVQLVHQLCVPKAFGDLAREMNINTKGH